MLKTTWAVLYALYDFLIPRFLTEEVALERAGLEDGWDDFDIVCALRDVQPGEKFDGIAEVDSFVWLRWGFTYRMGNFRYWPTKTKDWPNAANGDS
jgi:hypothetical protein